ncbi:MAG: hypothetical protein Q7V14_03045, partial [Coriobacteriia bacterium]|nr:hypothetical protein [Coriobacteriia bacterium]
MEIPEDMHHAAILRSRAPKLIASALVLSLLLATSAATGSPTSTSDSTPAGTPFVTLNKGAVSTPVGGSISFSVDVAVDRPTSYLESRIQIRSSSGRLMYQKTEVRSNVPTGSVSISYKHDLSPSDLRPGAYPIELRVRTQSNGVREWVLNDDLLVYDPSTGSVPVAIVVKIQASPSMDAEGRFVVDPSQSTRARDEAATLARLILGNPSLRITLAIPPVVLEEWLRASQGYAWVSVEGVVDVPADAAAPKAYADTLSLLKRAVASGRLELADVPYALPDTGALQRGDRLEDLGMQLLRGHSATFAALESSPAAGVVTADDLMPLHGASELRRAGATFAVLDPASLDSSETTPASGAYDVQGVPGLAALVLDPELSACLESAAASQCTSRVFSRSIIETLSAPISAVVSMGPGYRASMADLSLCLADLTEAPWASFVTASQAAATKKTESVALVATAPTTPGAPSGYWDEVARSRRYAAAFLGAVGVNDPEAQTASDLSLVAQSALWAGPDLNWGSADRGRAIAAASIRESSAVLDAITLGASDITLSSANGEVPISITNSSEKTLSL